MPISLTGSSDSTDLSALTEHERTTITSYRSATAVMAEYLGQVIGRPRFDTGRQPHDLAKALTDWWTAIGLLDQRMPHATAEARTVLNAERAQWFRCRQAVLVAVVDDLTAQGRLGEPGIPMPDDPRTGSVDELGYFGFHGFDQRVVCDVPLEIRLRVDPGGDVSVLGPDPS